MSEQTITAQIFRHLSDAQVFAEKWHIDIPADEELKTALSCASKRDTGNVGKPDLLYINRRERLLILGEVKADIKQYRSATGDKADQYALDGVLHYMRYFYPEELEKTRVGLSQSFRGWRIFGIAFAGDLSKEHYRASTHLLDPNGHVITDVNHSGFLDETEYISLYNNLETSALVEDIDSASKSLNEWLRSLDSQKRPVLLSALMICLIDGRSANADFRNMYRDFTSGHALVNNVFDTVEAVLEEEGISNSKIQVLLSELQFLQTDLTFSRAETLKRILQELAENVIPLFARQSNYDMLSKFYHDFLTYAGITNVKNGIVLTPKHVCDLFVELVDVRDNDVFLDPACGTGSFLITAMNKLNDLIRISGSHDITERLSGVKQNQLLGFEVNSTMYALSVSNMLFRGDGKSRVYNTDFFSPEADSLLEEMQPTIGFINPPYGGRSSTKSPTKKEIEFCERMLKHCSRYGVIIAPWSTFIGDEHIRERILSRHNLIYSINMPLQLFQPNASTCSTICVFKTNVPHRSGQDTILLDLVDDGFVLTKTKGRIDLFNRWACDVLPSLRDALNTGSITSAGSCVKTQLKASDEWLVQAHTSADYSALSIAAFVHTIKQYTIFLARVHADKLCVNLSDSEWIDLVSDYVLSDAYTTGSAPQINTETWQPFSLCDPANPQALFDVEGVKFKYRNQDIEELGTGDTLWITTSNKNNGVSGLCNAPKAQRDVLTVDSATNGKMFYQPFDFVGSDHVEILQPRKTTRLNPWTALFLITVCDLEMPRYGYGRKRAQKRLQKENILLPVNDAGLVDWDWIENCMKRLPYSQNVII